MTWAHREADRRARSKGVRSIENIGLEAFVRETAELKAENDARGVPAVPPGWHAVRRRLRLVPTATGGSE